MEALRLDSMLVEVPAIVAVSLGVVSDGADRSDDLAATCELLDGGEDGITVPRPCLVRGRLAGW